MIAITGNTYPVKDALKALGAKWNPDQKAWMVSEDKAEQARQIVNGAGPKTAAPKGGYVKQCKTGGNCSSFGSGRSCGGHDCDGY